MIIDCMNTLLNYESGNCDYHISTGVGNHQMMTYQFMDGFKPKRIHSSGSGCDGCWFTLCSWNTDGESRKSSD